MISTRGAEREIVSKSTHRHNGRHRNAQIKRATQTNEDPKTQTRTHTHACALGPDLFIPDALDGRHALVFGAVNGGRTLVAHLHERGVMGGVARVPVGRGCIPRGGKFCRMSFEEPSLLGLGVCDPRCSVCLVLGYQGVMACLPPEGVARVVGVCRGQLPVGIGPHGRDGRVALLVGGYQLGLEERGHKPTQGARIERQHTHAHTHTHTHIQTHN